MNFLLWNFKQTLSISALIKQTSFNESPVLIFVVLTDYFKLQIILYQMALFSLHILFFLLYMSFWMRHKNVFVQMSVKKCCFYINIGYIEIFVRNVLFYCQLQLGRSFCCNLIRNIPRFLSRLGVLCIFYFAD